MSDMDVWIDTDEDVPEITEPVLGNDDDDMSYSDYLDSEEIIASAEDLESPEFGDQIEGLTDDGTGVSSTFGSENMVWEGSE